MAHLIALKTKLKDKYNLQKEVSKMLEVDLGQHPVSLMVREAFMELQISDKVKEVLKVHYPQDPTPEYVDAECDCSGNESKEECLSLKEKESMEFIVAKAQKVPPDQGDCVCGMKKKLKIEPVQDYYIPYKFNGDSDSD